jgi:hypothetical protein
LVLFGGGLYFFIRRLFANGFRHAIQALQPDGDFFLG